MVSSPKSNGMLLGRQPLNFLGINFVFRCSSNKVYLLEAAALIDISYGERCEAKKVEEKSVGRSQHLEGNAPLSPNLGASPQLNKKNRNIQCKSSDGSLDFPGP